MKYAIAIASLIFTAASVASAVDKSIHPVLTPFKASFEARVKPWNLSGLATYELRHVAANRFELSLALKHSFLDIREKSTFEVVEQCTPKPLRYEYRRDPAIGRTRAHEVNFDFDTRTATFVNDGEKGLLQVPDTVIDQLSLLIALRCQQYEGKKLEFAVFARKRIKPYQFKLEATESVDTSLGPVQAQRFIRKRSNDQDNERTTRFWLSPLYSMQLIQAFQDEGNSETRLRLVSIKPSLPAFSESQP